MASLRLLVVALLVLLPMPSESATSRAPAGHLAIAVADEAAHSDTLYAVPIFDQLVAFAELDSKLRNLSSEHHLDDIVADEDVDSGVVALATCIVESSENIPSMNDQVVSQLYGLRDLWTLFGREFTYFRLSPSRKWTIRELQDQSERWICAFVSAAFITAVVDRHGESWLFSSAFDDDLAALDREIARQFDAAYHSTRFHCFLFHETQLMVFDRVYDRCVGARLASLHLFRES